MVNQKETIKLIINALPVKNINNDIIIKQLKELINDGFNINTRYLKGNTLAHYVVKHKREGILSDLVDLGLNINICNDAYDTPLHRCVKTHNYVLASELIRNGSDINQSGEFEETPIHMAVAERDAKMVELLIENNADISLVDEKNISAYQYACDDGNEEIKSIFEKYVKEI